jgi:hypothetical protein
VGSVFLEKRGNFVLLLWTGRVHFIIASHIKVYYDEDLFEECITSKPIIAMGKIAINYPAMDGSEF